MLLSLKLHLWDAMHLTNCWKHWNIFTDDVLKFTLDCFEILQCLECFYFIQDVFDFAVWVSSREIAFEHFHGNYCIWPFTLFYLLEWFTVLQCSMLHSWLKSRQWFLSLVQGKLSVFHSNELTTAMQIMQMSPTPRLHHLHHQEKPTDEI